MRAEYKMFDHLGSPPRSLMQEHPKHHREAFNTKSLDYLPLDGLTLPQTMTYWRKRLVS